MIETGFLSTKDQKYNQAKIVIGGGPAPVNVSGGGQIKKVLKIEKIMNNNIYDKFTLELRKTLKKYT